MMHQSFLLLGTNLGDRLLYMKEAIEMLKSHNCNITGASSVYETEPVGMNGVNDFLNRVIIIQTVLNPFELLDTIQIIEQQLGRKRLRGIQTSRTMDIDILFYDDIIIQEDKLTIPHPRLHLRKFCLIPLRETAPAFLHPLLKKDMKTLTDECPDPSYVKLYPVLQENDI